MKELVEISTKAQIELWKALNIFFTERSRCICGEIFENEDVVGFIISGTTYDRIINWNSKWRG